jgi:hypothetical protein
MSYPDIDDIIIQDFNESDAQFLERKQLTHKIVKLNHLNHVTAVTCARLMMNKLMLGVTYEVEIENILNGLKIE